MKNKTCENCKHWRVETAPAIGKCKKFDCYTVAASTCNKFEPSLDMPDFFKDIFFKYKSIDT